MKKLSGFVLAAVVGLFISIGSAFAGSAPNTAFTYQGRLNAGTGPATGTYDLTFALFADSNGTTQIDNTLTNPAVTVSNGLFVVNLDFGDGVFVGQPLWLQIGVRTNGDSTFTLLNPLQQLTPTPHAIYSLNAGAATFAKFADMAGAASNLTGTLQSTQLNGTISVAQLPSGLVTNGSKSVVLNGTFSGDGSGLANVNSVINNTSDNPVPVAVQGTVAVQGAVAIGGSVQITPLPLAIYDVDNPVRQAVTFSTSALIFATNVIFNIPLATVPPDRTLVIESFSAFVDGYGGGSGSPPSFFPIPPTNQYQVILQTFSTTPWATNSLTGTVYFYTNDAPYYGFTLPSGNGYCLPALTQTMKAYAGPTSTVLLNCIGSRPIGSTSPPAVFHVSITGHYVYNVVQGITNAPPPSSTSNPTSGGGGGSSPPSGNN